MSHRSSITDVAWYTQATATRPLLLQFTTTPFPFMTAWQRMSFDRPADLTSSYELHGRLRNYSLTAWRNTRRFITGPVMQEVTDVVGKDVAIRRDGAVSPWAPLSIAYVDERRNYSRSLPIGCCWQRAARATCERSPTRRL